MQLRLQHNAADSAPGQHQCVSDQARHFDDVTADAKATIHLEGEYQSPKVVVPSSVPSSAAGASAATPRLHQHVASASAATLMQLRLQHNAADSAPGQHQCMSDQARHFDDVTADAKATSIKIEEFQELYRHTRQNRDVA
nr:hypothetical protein CFP56_45955 [Quercus suber]